MSSFLSSLIVLALSALALLPLAVAWRRPGTGSAVAGFYLLSFLTMILGGSILSPSPEPIDFATLKARPGTPAAGACADALALAEQGGIILLREPARVIVNGGIWRELPQQARDALVGCLESARPGGPSDRPLEIVER